MRLNVPLETQLIGHFTDESFYTVNWNGNDNKQKTLKNILKNTKQNGHT